jgi:hypothetical protein
LSAVAGVSFWNVYFKLVQAAVRAPEIVSMMLRSKAGSQRTQNKARFASSCLVAE